MPEYVYPLSAFDTLCIDLGMTLGCVLTNPHGLPYDPKQLADAAERVAAKWPLLAGKVFRDEKSKLFYLRIPSETQKLPVIKFTVATHRATVDHIQAHRSRSITPRPPFKYFRHPSTPFRAISYAARAHPLISIHVSHLDNATCVGFSAPHGVFDAIGLGMVVNAISDELLGRDWMPPPSVGYNVITEAARSLPRNAVKPEISHHLEREWPIISIRNVIQTITIHLLERWWWCADTKALYVHEDDVKKLVDPVKSELKAVGKWASTGDILLAWFVKAALANESSSYPVSIQSVASLRKALAKYDPLAQNYPHNCIADCPMKLFTHSEIASMSVAELASHHREHVTNIYDPSSVSAIVEHLGPPASSTPLFASRHFGTTMLHFSNHSIANMSAINFGGGTDLVGCWHFFGPFDGDHEIYISKFGEGYTFIGSLRKCRWEAVEKIMAKL